MFVVSIHHKSIGVLVSQNLNNSLADFRRLPDLEEYFWNERACIGRAFVCYTIFGFCDIRIVNIIIKCLVTAGTHAEWCAMFIWFRIMMVPIFFGMIICLLGLKTTTSLVCTRYYWQGKDIEREQKSKNLHRVQSWTISGLIANPITLHLT